jgi:hypothetical protein
MIISNECNDLIFEHYVGSVLIDNSSTDSDIDLFRIYKNEFVIIDSGIWHETAVMDIALRYCNTNALHYMKSEEKLDVTNISILKLLDLLSCQDTKDVDISMLSRAVSHLYAIKYNLILEIKDQELYNLYIDWLKSPAISGIFWDRIKQVFWGSLDSLPDKEKNWSQKFDGSQEHSQLREQWLMYNKKYPVVDEKVGYDTVNCKRIIQDILIATCILTPNKIITNEEKQYLNRIREGSLPFKEYKQVKSHVWKQFRTAVESMTQAYYLGEGYSIEEARQKNMFGVESFFNFLAKISNTRALSVDNNLNIRRE